MTGIKELGEFPEISEKFNMHIAWLVKIDRLITLFTMSRVENDIENMFIALDLLEATISPKVDKDEVEENLKWLEENRDSHNVLDYSGSKDGEETEKKKEIIKKCMDTFKLILLKLQKSGILTYVAGDPGKAMGKFQ